MPETNRACKHRNCSKTKRNGPFCAKHAAAEGIVVVTHSPRGMRRRIRFPHTTSPDGYCDRIILPHHILEAWETLSRGVDVNSPAYFDRRWVVSMDQAAKETDIYKTIPTYLAQFISELLILESTTLVIAPPVSQRKPQCQHGPAQLHRDTASDDAGYLTLLICLSDVTKDNGSVTLYPSTQRTTLDAKCRKTSVTGKQSVMLTGEKGTGWLFDSRLLHQSNANATEETRLTVNCLLRTRKMLERNIVV
jgi:ectoine hydroxylase-related dioxygenase (phytanoyl-CoA dioxygenase family)